MRARPALICAHAVRPAHRETAVKSDRCSLAPHRAAYSLPRFVLVKSILGFLALLLLVVPTVAAAPEYRSMGPDIFDPRTKAEDLITQAVTRATREDKRILLLFGANWCPWCRRLHAALSTESAVRQKLQQKFVLVYADANTRNDKLRNAAVL